MVSHKIIEFSLQGRAVNSQYKQQNSCILWCHQAFVPCKSATCSPFCPQDTQCWARTDHLRDACLVRLVQAISLPCLLLLVQKTWKLNPNSGLQIAPPFFWLVKGVINPLAGLLSLHHSVVYEHTHKFSFHYRGHIEVWHSKEVDRFTPGRWQRGGRK